VLHLQGISCTITIDGVPYVCYDGNGIIINNLGKIILNLFIRPDGYYVGMQTVWVLRGNLGSCDGGNCPTAVIDALKAVNPSDGSVFEDLTLSGPVTIVSS
jgi:hypothetical protein